ncbi:shikimate dehydrogenase [Butyrivibrio sp. M55]|uniref:shikimate dehydrogenase n=1 Tax=Butyrivibrio sp. M55 TaxID=1855323 RepID=UPI0008EBA91E|nr:shikimate dehydrogenase [Butyrivibrio sp. M55]SFU79685.1 shikimate dehydrogenase /shikimate kinase [Butyrivibrio sp. M55]
MNHTDGNTLTCGLIGNPVRHTLSPLIHNSIAAMKGINLVYVPFEVPKGGVKNAVRGANALGIKGLNVTVPYKSDVIDHLVEVDPLAEGIGAVNTLVRTDGGFKGYNTDMSGLYHAMQDEGIVLDGECVVILGAGGVARPVAYLCASKGAEKVYVLNRTYEKAETVAKEVNSALDESLGEKIIPMPLENYKELLEKEKRFFAVQCTSVGLFPDVNSAPIEDAEFYKHVYAAIDVVYKPLETKFMKMVKDAGGKVFSGLKMLLYQGIDAFELWFEEEGVKISKEEADIIYKSLMMEVLGATNIILEGFMGSGKSTVSEILSDKLDLELIDTDEAIEEAEGRKISDIFEQDGEEAFRDMETGLVEMMVSDHMRETVISLGGGLPVREKNRELLKKVGKVVYLRTAPETVYDRLKGDDTRPLLKSEDPLARIKELQDKRGKIYEEAADIIVDTDGKTPVQVADEIIAAIGFVK